MKKVLYTLVVLLALTWSMPASAKLRYGITGGLNLTKLGNMSENVKSENRAGWFIGPKVQFNVPVINIGIDAALLYSQRRINTTSDTATTSKSKSTTYQSIEIPINLRYTFGLGETAGIYVSTGPQFGFNIGNRNFAQLANVESYKMKDANMTWNFGVGASLLNHLEVGIGYNLQLGKMGDITYRTVATSGYNTVTKKVKANTWQIQATYLF